MVLRKTVSLFELIELELIELYLVLFILLQNCLPPLLVKRLIEAGTRVTHLLHEKDNYVFPDYQILKKLIT